VKRFLQDPGQLKRVREELGRSATVTEAIYGAGFNSNGRFYATSSDVLGMTPSQFRSGGSKTEIKFAIGDCSLGLVLVAASDKGVCAILFGDDPETLAGDLKKQFPRAQLVGGDKSFEQLASEVIGFVENPRNDFDLPLDTSWHCLSASRVGRAAPYSRRVDSQLCRDCENHRRAKVDAGSRPRLRHEPHRRGHPLPSRGEERWLALGLSRRGRAQARPSRQRGEVIISA
jgi:hypothetical protein